MYIDKDGNVEVDEFKQIVDIISTNIIIDRYDIPYSNLGITRAVPDNSKQTLIDKLTADFAELLIINRLTSKVKLLSVEVDRGTVILNTNISDKDLKFTIK